MRVYISGAITNEPNYISKFHKAEIDLKARGHLALNPARIGNVVQNNTPWPLEYDDFMMIDEILLKQCDGIYMLKGYEHSTGALHELMIATRDGKEIMYEEVLP